jgi:anaerobic ribonucleoside-triphosphate reductase activating protein
VLVDGPFILSERILSLKWSGSSNQRLIDVKRSLAERRTLTVE